MLVVNLLGGPGSGKSTLASELYSMLKKEAPRLRVELVTEYVKGAVYGENKAALDDQFYLTAKHCHNLNKLRGKTDIVITDCSLLNAVVYLDSYELGSWQHALAKAAASSAWSLMRTFDNLAVLVKRDVEKVYQQSGRTQSESEAKDIDLQFESLAHSLPSYIDTPFARHVVNKTTLRETTDKILAHYLTKKGILP